MEAPGTVLITLVVLLLAAPAAPAPPAAAAPAAAGPAPVAAAAAATASPAAAPAASAPPVVASAAPTRPRWIVVTTVSPPMPSIKKLASLPGWRVVAVGDAETPAGWSHPNVTFLDVAAQATLGFASAAHVPLNSYARKNLGFLFAISRGARVVYETDDNNELAVGNVLALAPSEAVLELSPPRADGAAEPGTYAVLDAGGPPAGFNPYPLFGQPQMWPRGLPLASVKAQPPMCFERRRAAPLIQQGLADKEPDVDAIYRLALPLNVSFDPHAFSVLLPPGAMAPFNSKNTLFLRDALWAMVLPATTTMRVCDIWRGYWAQRLLWDIGGSLAFLPPTVVQHRNPHNAFRDMLEEADLHTKAGALLKDLRAWRGSAPDLPGRMVELAALMARKGYWGDGDVKLIEAWVADLKRLKYEFPPLRGGGWAGGSGSGSGSGSKEGGAEVGPADTDEGPFASVAGGGASGSLSLRGGRPYLSLFGPGHTVQHKFLLPRRWCWSADMALIVNYNHFGRGSVADMHMLHAAYRPYFRHVLFTGVVPADMRAGGGPAAAAPAPELERLVDCDNYNRHGNAHMPGHFAYACAAAAMAAAPAPAASAHELRPPLHFFYINDDVLFSPCMMGVFNSSRLWYDADRGQKALRNMLPIETKLDGWWWPTDFSGGRRPGRLRSHLKSAMRNVHGWAADRMAARAAAQRWRERGALPAVGGAATPGALLSDGGDDGAATAAAAERRARRIADADRFGFFDYAQADTYFLPSQLAGHFRDLAHHMRGHYVLSEAAVPNILGLMAEGADDAEFVPWEWLWDADRDALLTNITSALPLGRNISWPAVRAVRADQVNDWHTGPLIPVSGPDLFALHPVKLSHGGAKAHVMNWLRSQNCPGGGSGGGAVGGGGGGGGGGDAAH